MSKLSICLPVPSSPLSTQLCPGSAIVTPAQLTEDGQWAGEDCLIWFEGNIHGAVNLVTFPQKVANAADRLLTQYPTSGIRMVSTEELTAVGQYDAEFKTIQIDRPDLVAAWESGTGVFDGNLQDPASVRLTLDIDYELNGTRLEDLKVALRHAIERNIGNGALTAATDAEVDAWRLSIR